MIRTMILLVAALSLPACSGENGPGADADAAAPTGMLSADSAALPTTADATGAPADPASAEQAPATVSHAGTQADGAAAGPAAQRPSDPAQTAASSPAPAPASTATIQAPTQAVDDAAAVLLRAAAAYGNVRSLRADFVMTREIPALRQTITSRGTLYQRSPDRVALRFSEPAGDVILSDGEYFWVYYPSVNAQQVMQQPATEGGRSGVDLQAQFVGNPTERFTATLHGTETVGGRQAHVLTLVPRQRAEYRSLKVWLDARDSLARRFEIVEHNASIRRFDLEDLRTNVAIPDATFRFTPPAGARIISGG